MRINFHLHLKKHLKIFTVVAFTIIKLLRVSSKLMSKLYLVNIYVTVGTKKTEAAVVFSQKENNGNMFAVLN